MNDNQFSEQYAESCYNQLQTVEQEVIDSMGTPELVTFRLTGRPNDMSGEDDSDFLDRLMMSAPAINDALNHILMGWYDVRWSVIGQEDGLPVWYLNVYVSNSLGRYDFMRVVHRHVSHSPVAFRQDHDYDTAITIRNIGGSNPLVESETLLPVEDIDKAIESPSEAPIASYVASHLCGFRDDSDDCERLQRTISNASNVDSQWLPGPTFENVFDELSSDWSPEGDLPDTIDGVIYGRGMLTDDDHISNGLNVESVA